MHPERTKGSSYLPSLHLSSYKNIEIIIIDDGSTDETPHICRRLLADGKIDKFFRNEERGGKASAANLALRFCKGEYVVHLDADSHVNDSFVENMILPFFHKKNIGAVAGDVRVNNIHDDLSTSLQAIEYIKKIAIGRRIVSFLHLLRIVSGACGAFRKDILDRIGGWDIGPGLDGDITVKIRKLGFRIFFEPSALCYTNAPDTFTKLCRQRYRWDKSLIRFRLRKHVDVFFPTGNFRLLNFLSFVENILFNIVLNFLWWAYFLMVLFSGQHSLIYIFPMTLLLYAIVNLFQFVVGLLLTDKDARKKLFPLIVYIPLMPIYSGIMLRIVRTYAYIAEWFFKASYKDPWNPRKVSIRAEEAGL